MLLTFKVKESDPKTLIISRLNEPWKEVAKVLFLGHLQTLLRGISLEEYSLLEEKIAKREVLRMLARRPYLSKEIIQKLSQKGLSLDPIQKAVHFCQEKGFINDEEEVKRLVAKEQRKGLGSRAIRMKLKYTKNIDATTEDLSDEEVLSQWLEKKKPKIEDESARQKLIAKLMRRGFSFDTILKLLSPSQK